MLMLFLLEDTRVTGQLLKHLNINKKIISNYDFNELENLNKLLDYLKKVIMWVWYLIEGLL